MPTKIRDAVMARQARKQTAACKVCTFLEQQSRSEREEWTALLAEHPNVIQHTALADEMTARAQEQNPGAPPITMDNVSKHRKNGHAALLS